MAIQEDAMKDPMKFVEKLQRGEDLGIPEQQVIAEVGNNVIRIFGWVTIVSKEANRLPDFITVVNYIHILLLLSELFTYVNLFCA